MKALLEINAFHFCFTVLTDDAEVQMPTVEQQAADSKLGVMADSSSSSTFVKSINQLFTLATGNTDPIVQHAEKK